MSFREGTGEFDIPGFSPDVITFMKIRPQLVWKKSYSFLPDINDVVIIYVQDKTQKIVFCWKLEMMIFRFHIVDGIIMSMI